MDKVAVNPFVTKINHGFCHFAHLTLKLPLVLIRLSVIASFVGLIWISSFILYQIRKIHDPKDHSKWRDFYVKIPASLARAAFFCAGLYSIETINIDDKDKGEIYMLFPHTSIFDMALPLPLGFPPFIAISTLSNNFFLKYLVRLANPIIVNKEDRYSRKKAKAAIVERGKRRQTIALFPEGACGNGQLLLRLKTGGFAPGLRVKPIIIRSDYTKGWTWEGNSLPFEIFLTLAKWRSHVQLIGLPVYVPNEREKLDARLYAANVEKYVESKTDLKWSYYGGEDGKFLLLATELKLPRSPSVLKLLHLCWKVLKVKYEHGFDDENNNNNSSNSSEASRRNGSRTNHGKEFVNQIENWYQKKLEAGYGSLSSSAINFFRSLTPLSLSGKSSLSNCARREEKVLKDHYCSTELAKLRRLLQRLISSILRNLNNLDVPANRIASAIDVLKLFQLENSPIANSSLVADFLMTINGSSRDWVTPTEFRVLLTLCDTQESDLWKRVATCFSIFGQDRQPANDDGHLTGSQFKILIWFLLGIEESLTSEYFPSNMVIDLDYAKTNLVRLFGRAVQENAPCLLQNGQCIKSEAGGRKLS